MFSSLYFTGLIWFLQFPWISYCYNLTGKKTEVQKRFFLRPVGEVCKKKKKDQLAPKHGCFWPGLLPGPLVCFSFTYKTLCVYLGARQCSKSSTNTSPFIRAQLWVKICLFSFLLLNLCPSHCGIILEMRGDFNNVSWRHSF